MRNIPVYTVDTGIPVPETSDKAPVPIGKLEVGESILFPLSERNVVQSRASNFKKRSGKVFVIKKQDSETARVWRKE